MIINVLVDNRIVEIFLLILFLFFLLYFLCLVMENEEMIGEWLNEKIIIGISNYKFFKVLIKCFLDIELENVERIVLF